MKHFFCLLLLSVTGYCLQAQNIHVPDTTKKIQWVQAACGKCQFNMGDDDCLLTVRINGKAYHVTGTSIDDHGDAHAKNGFCNAIRKAAVQGEIKNNEFEATYFKLAGNKTKSKIKR